MLALFQQLRPESLLSAAGVRVPTELQGNEIIKVKEQYRFSSLPRYGLLPRGLLRFAPLQGNAAIIRKALRWVNV